MLGLFCESADWMEKKQSTYALREAFLFRDRHHRRSLLQVQRPMFTAWRSICYSWVPTRKAKPRFELLIKACASFYARTSDGPPCTCHVVGSKCRYPGGQTGTTGSQVSDLERICQHARQKELRVGCYRWLLVWPSALAAEVARSWAFLGMHRQHSDRLRRNMGRDLGV